jgi:hypothetical protein
MDDIEVDMHLFIFTIKGTKSLRVENLGYNVEKHQKNKGPCKH